MMSNGSEYNSICVPFAGAAETRYSKSISICNFCFKKSLQTGRALNKMALSFFVLQYLLNWSTLQLMVVRIEYL